MPILKIRDENGNFIPIRSVRGERGPQGIQGEQGIKGETGDSGVYIGNEEPTNDANVWIDTDENPTEELLTKTEADAKYLTLETLPVYNGGVS